MSFIKIIAIGNLTRDPEVRVLPKGTQICQFGIAASKKWKDDSGTEREDTCFVDVEAWGKTAENIAKYFKKGSPIFIEGTLRLDSWEDKTSGQKRTKHKVVMERFEFIGGRKESDGAPAQRSEQPAPQSAQAAPAADGGDLPPF